MRSAHTVDRVRAAEADLLAQLPEGTLMQRAAFGLATAIADYLGRTYGARVLLLIGSGNNGGDALYAGAVLARRGASVEAILVGTSVHKGGLAALRAAGGRTVDVSEAHRPDVLIDGIVGIGGHPGLRAEAAAALDAFAGVPIVSVDVPSGVGVDTGEVEAPHVTADLTVTFGTEKICHLVEPAASAAGVVELVDIGLDLPEAAVTALQAHDVAAMLPRPTLTAHKYTRGVVGVRAGSRMYPGAAVMCVSGAAAGLCGMVRYVGDARDEVLAAHPDVVAGNGRVEAWVVGSGTEADEHGGAAALAQAQRDGVPLVVDAGAIAGIGRCEVPTLITPHAGELASLLGVERAEVEAHGLEFVRRAAVGHRCVVMLKGPHTLIADPTGRVRVTTTGTPWLATAGAGDVLAGLCGALVAAGLDPFDAGSVGSWLHGAAATLASAGGPLSAPRVAEAIPEVARRLTR